MAERERPVRRSGWLLGGAIVAWAAVSDLFRSVESQGPSAESLRAGHEPSDVNARGVAWVGAAVIVGAVAMHVGFGAAFFALRRHDQRESGSRAVVEEALVRERTPPPPPRLQSLPAADLRAYLESQRELLSSYRWVDRRAGRARIPIERAMEILGAAP